ncbi:ParM/StbA family protein [Cupriavidus malaysiensis]|uniref:ParM/StbA family protein n=1 Tax=Cupriavidus malaysiensis TaxID=367825 RepID=A0ABM6FGQ7_9BURK|nr:ParM/StbA family protein [Cupriavidus malaysiensis]AOZ11128.1 hypothetical protein BKK80_34795 [Cupriavidus malaysiensis]
MMQQTYIGIDIGRSSTKLVAAWDHDGSIQRKNLIFPSAVSPAIEITDATTAQHARSDIVAVGERTFFIGKTALLQGKDEMTGGLRDDWAARPEHMALFLGSLHKLRLGGVPRVDTAILVLGLPAKHYASQHKQLAKQLSAQAPGCTVRLRPQPLGPLMRALFLDDGRENPEIDPDNERWAVIEIGQYTTDFALLEHGQVIETASDSGPGMRLAAEQLIRELQNHRGISIDLPEATEILEKKVVRHFGESINVEPLVLEAVRPLANVVAQKAEQLFGQSVRKLNGILVAGGGASLIQPHLAAQWRHARLVEDPRFAVAEGFCRFAIAYHRSQAAVNVGQGSKVA